MMRRLGELARTEEGREMILNTGCIPEVVKILIDPDTVEATTALITNLAFSGHSSGKVAAALCKSGVIERLTWVLEFAPNVASNFQTLSANT